MTEEFNFDSRLQYLEGMSTFYDAQLNRFGTEMKNCEDKIEIIISWILTRFGVDLSSSKQLNSDHNQLKRGGNNNTLQKRTRQIIASIRKRRCSSRSKTVKSSQQITLQGHPENITRTLETISPEKNTTSSVIKHTNTVSTENVISNEANKALQKRGRPKKNPNEKCTPKNKTPMVCDECGKCLKGPSSLRSHKLSLHSNSRPHECGQCGKAFRLKHHLDFHLLTHDEGGKKKFQCRFCDKGFIAQRDLSRHIRTHTGERPFPCPYLPCSKRFNVKQHLILHIRTHTKEKPYLCECGKTFTQANSLRIHKMKCLESKEKSQVSPFQKLNESNQTND